MGYNIEIVQDYTRSRVEGVWGLSLHSQKARSDDFANFLPIFPMGGHGVVVTAFAYETEGPWLEPGRELVLLLSIVQFLLRVLKAF